MALESGIPAVPRGLKTASKRWFRALVEEYSPTEAELRLIEIACRAHDRAEACRRLVDKEGLTVHDRFGQVKAHPALIEERQQRDLVRRTIASLAFPADTSDDFEGFS